MSFLRQTIEVYRHQVGERDPEGADYGRPVGALVLVATFRGAIQQKSVRELAVPDGIGVAIGTHRVFLEPSAESVVAKGDVLRKVSGDPAIDEWANGDYQVEGTPNRYGGHHVELDATRIEA